MPSTDCNLVQDLDMGIQPTYLLLMTYAAISNSVDAWRQLNKGLLSENSFFLYDFNPIRIHFSNQFGQSLKSVGIIIPRVPYTECVLKIKAIGTPIAKIYSSRILNARINYQVFEVRIFRLD